MARFSISDIERFTGVKAHTLRIWEQRYQILIPKRTDTNIRYYDDDDLKYLLNVSILLNFGYRISEIARMDRPLLEQTVVRVSESDKKFPGHIKALSSAMLSMDENAFNKVLSTNILQMGLEQTMMQVVFPFLKEIGLLWVTGSIHPAHEHFITNLIKQKLYVAIDGQTGRLNAESQRFLIYLPESETHEIGLLFANYLLRLKGHETIYLGQTTPEEDLIAVFDFYKPHFIITSLTSMLSDDEVKKFIDTTSRLWQHIHVFITGSRVMGYTGELPANIRIFHQIDTFHHLVSGLPQLEKPQQKSAL